MDSLRGRANARNVSFRISLRWPIHIINPVDKTKLSCYTSHRRSTTVSLETHLYSFVAEANFVSEKQKNPFECFQKQLAFVANISRFGGQRNDFRKQRYGGLKGGEICEHNQLDDSVTYNGISEAKMLVWSRTECRKM